MIKETLIYIIVALFHYLGIVWEFFFEKFGTIYLVYYIRNNNNGNGDNINTCIKENITLNYYTNYWMDNYKSGTYYVKVFNKHGINHVTFKGSITDIPKIKILDPHENRPKRRNIILVYNDNPIDINLEILDNYRRNMVNQYQPITNLGEILSLMDISCTNVTIIQSMPFLRQSMSVNSVDIDLVYY